MITDLIIGIVIGVIGFIFFAGLLIIISWAIWYTVNKDYKYRVRIRNMSGGKAVMEWVKAKKIKHEKLGEAYYMPSLTKENRSLAPVLGSEYEFPLGKKWYVALTYYSGEYAPEKFEPTSETIKRDVIEEDPDKVGFFRKVTKDIQIYILRPVPKSIRKWVLDADKVANSENMIKLSWFERNKEIILIIVLAIITGALCIMALLFTFQYTTAVATNVQPTPQWAIDLLNYSITNSTGAPPTLG